MWPFEAITVKPRPRNFVSVRDLVGDSTMTSALRAFAAPPAGAAAGFAARVRFAPAAAPWDGARRAPPGSS